MILYNNDSTGHDISHWQNKKLMSVQTALQFIKKVRSDEKLKNKVLALASNADLESLVKIGESAGLTFTADELQAAHKHDWAMRWLFYTDRKLD